MDGIEWKRAKWSRPVQAWFWINERFGCWFGNHLIADNPGIADHLATRVSRSKITMIPYGAEAITGAAPEILHRWGLQPGNFATLIARPEPENSILEVVSAFSRRPRGMKLLVLGKYDPGQVYHKRVLDAASDEVVFAGAIYDKDIVKTLRFHSALYVHGHQVGGTNPSLVEALGAGNAMLAHVVIPSIAGWLGWRRAISCMKMVATGILGNSSLRCTREGHNALPPAFMQSCRERHGAMFTWEKVLAEYEGLLAGWRVVA